MSFVDVPAPHGRLEALFWRVEEPLAAAVVCHPHPLYGGTMHNHVAYRIAKALRDARVSALRFNFRGVGRSTGEFDHGRGEVDDAAAALDFLSRESPGAPLFAAGFSFGARVALELACRDERVERVLAVGLAVDLGGYEFLKALRKPAVFVQGERDEFGALPRVEEVVSLVPGPRRLFVVPGCDHLASECLDALLASLREAVAWLASA